MGKRFIMARLDFDPSMGYRLLASFGIIANLKMTPQTREGVNKS